MQIIPEHLKKQLKKPLGGVYKITAVKKIAAGQKVISVGDISTLSLLKNGIRPHVAVFDFIYQRKPLGQKEQAILKKEAGIFKKYTNRAGTLSLRLLKDAPLIIKKGVWVKINGEEDLTALVFIVNLPPSHIVVYGQPHEGLVVVKPSSAIKKKIKKILSSWLSW